MLSSVLIFRNHLKFKIKLASIIFCLLSINTLAFAQKSSFTSRLINIEAATNEAFRFNTTLVNGNSSSQLYELKAQLPTGWLVSYRVDGSTVTSLQVDANTSKEILVEISCPLTTSPKKYNIPLSAVSNTDTLKLNLEAVVRGSYNLQLTTPSGRLSDEIVAGNSKELTLTVKNDGTLPLNNLELSSQLPTGWETSFTPSNIEQLQPGKSVNVTATIKVPEKTIAGDYVANFNALASNGKPAEISIRMVVKTSLLSGWLGLVIILAAAGLIYYLIRKYGRR